MILFFWMFAFVPFNDLELAKTFHITKSPFLLSKTHTVQIPELWKRPVKQNLYQADQCKIVILPQLWCQLFVF